MLDRFSAQARLYARYRINYPPALYSWLLARVAGRTRAWDCATGNGQVAAVLAGHFGQVDATDISAAQLAQAPVLANVHYQVSRAETTPFPAAGFDLITVAQAVHWFEADAFHQEAHRVLRPGGALAEWGYSFCHTEGAAVNRVLHQFHDQTSAPYWDANRQHINEEYARLSFPFANVQLFRFEVSRQWRATDMLGYLRSWSATANYARQHHGADLVALVEEELRALWGPGKRMVRFPVFGRFGVAA
ncbi:class I SAM-dependent methyltransferase [Hymenobacter rubripertinctus]|uniref:Class I SAM-dependent methyltransferase n=1 Tax=Hymenobacter rubripertinctus TaxID=2029981 RepID=A0A418QT59_9BACT|nr:class I SAM-dependent methyltransferase [Hymenobacter rubripertinctus]RIY08301.1 class I SAM-dependent methyltransferase [Hymenobacter rubripertinctus]